MGREEVGWWGAGPNHLRSAPAHGSESPACWEVCPHPACPYYHRLVEKMTISPFGFVASWLGFHWCLAEGSAQSSATMETVTTSFVLLLISALAGTFCCWFWAVQHRRPRPTQTPMKARAVRKSTKTGFQRNYTQRLPSRTSMPYSTQASSPCPYIGNSNRRIKVHQCIACERKLLLITVGNLFNKR